MSNRSRMTLARVLILLLAVILTTGFAVFASNGGLIPQ